MVDKEREVGNALVDANRKFHPPTASVERLTRACKCCGKVYGQDLTNYTMTLKNNDRPGQLILGLGEMDLCQQCINYFAQRMLEAWSKVVWGTRSMRALPDGSDDGKFIESSLVHIFRAEADSPERIVTKP